MSTKDWVVLSTKLPEAERALVRAAAAAAGVTVAAFVRAELMPRVRALIAEQVAAQPRPE